MPKMPYNKQRKLLITCALDLTTNGIFTVSTLGLGTALMVSHGALRTTPFIWCYGTFLLLFRASPSRHQMPHFHLIPNFLVHTKCRFTHLSPQVLYNVPFFTYPTERTKKQKSLKFCRPQVTYPYKYLRSAAFSILVQSPSNKAKKSLGVRINCY